MMGDSGTNYEEIIVEGHHLKNALADCQQWVSNMASKEEVDWNV
jgi:hypothetical protein